LAAHPKCPRAHPLSAVLILSSSMAAAWSRSIWVATTRFHSARSVAVALVSFIM